MFSFLLLNPLHGPARASGGLAARQREKSSHNPSYNTDAAQERSPNSLVPASHHELPETEERVLPQRNRRQIFSRTHNLHLSKHGLPSASLSLGTNKYTRGGSSLSTLGSRVPRTRKA